MTEGAGQFKTLLFGFILVALFGMLILTAVVQTGNDYGMDTSQVVGGSLALDNFNKSINNIQSDSEALKSQFDQQSIWNSIAGIVINLGGIVGIAKDMFSMVLLPFNIVADILNNMLAVPVFVTAVLLGLLILTAIFGIWRMIKLGD